ncbi:MAG TPA: Solitary outer membrane autotransporter beta-barrel domain [Verrucomicrobiae bacterium]|nr:Solitary outer membrane autotransporter beta-barrel domain [Verrucomicrobiae bacterium]
MPSCSVAVAACSLVPALFGQALPQDTVDRLKAGIGNRIETATILGGDYSAVGGTYAFRGGNRSDLSVGKLGGGGELGLHPLGQTGMTWAPVLQGNIGVGSAENHFENTALAGNALKYDTVALEFGGGVSFHLTDHFSIAPTISGIYGHMESSFEANNPAGNLVKLLATGTLVDWAVDTWTVVPAIKLKYNWNWQRTIFELSSYYNYFHTESFNSSSVLVNVNGDSHTWENRLDVDVPTGLHLFGRELHTGGFFSRTELFGGISDGLSEDHFYTLNSRFVMDFLGELWKVRWLGLGASYFWGDNFSGWSMGVDLRLQF